MKTIQFQVEAEVELDRAFLWYLEQSRKAATGFLNEMASLQAQIRQNPRSFPVVTSNIRKALLHRYPYYLLFRETEAEIEVLTVSHAKRKPRYWGGLR